MRIRIIIICWMALAFACLARADAVREYSSLLPLVGIKEIRCGDFTYEVLATGAQRLKRIEIPGGFIASDTAFWYVTDYQGNVRQVVNGATGSVVQKLDYYPYGMPFGETAVSKISGSTGASNPYKYGAKELLTAGGLNLYDYGPRMSDSNVGRFTTPDPQNQNYFWLSPFVYCGGDPINNVDPSGMTVIAINEDEQEMIINTLPSDAKDFVSFNEYGVLDVNLLGTYSNDGQSENFSHLLEMAASESYTFEVILGEKLQFRDANGNYGSRDFNGIEYDEIYKDSETLPRTGEAGDMGKTNFPGIGS